jgi:hypothetical protein
MTDFEIDYNNLAKYYSAAMDSVDLINELVAKPSLDDEEVEALSRNVEHLEIMMAKDLWTTENLDPLNAAIVVGKS